MIDNRLSSQKILFKKKKIKKIIDFLLYAINSVHQKYFFPPNIHIQSKGAVLKKVLRVPVYIRKSYSDLVRVKEVEAGIYNGDNVFLKILNTNIKPTVLFDFGANIGLSSLSMINSIRSIDTVVLVEAEEQNFQVMQKNCLLWGEISDINFYPVHGMISGKSEAFKQVSSLQKGSSTSGTFMYESIDESIGINLHNANLSITPSNLIEKYKLKDEIIVCKIDIEGGESGLFTGDTTWIDDVAYFTIELHDRFDCRCKHSSINVLKTIIKHDFAVVPGVDTLFCFNRKYDYWSKKV